MMIRSLTFTTMFISTLVIQLVVDFNLIGMVELGVGVGIMLRSAWIRPRADTWTRRVLLLLGSIFLFFTNLVLVERNPAIPIHQNVTSIITLITALLVLDQTGKLIRTRMDNEWQEKLKQTIFITAIALVLTITVYHPFISISISPVTIMGHTILGLAYLYNFYAIERYNEQLVLDVDANEWLYRSAEN